MIRVGTAGWSYRDWEGIVYPSRKPPGFHPIAHLARSFECVEINASFYAAPRAEHAASWVRMVRDRPNFRFTAKLLQSFTHGTVRSSAAFEAEARAWLEGVGPLLESDRLAAVLVQFPVSFEPHADSFVRLDRIHAAFGHLPLVFELRHRDWFTAAMLRRIERMGASLAMIDLPDSHVHPPRDAAAVGPIGYLRLHGRNSETWFTRGVGRDARYDYLYTPGEVKELARTAKRLAAGVDDTYVITNNHFAGKAAVNALELLVEFGGEVPRAPSELVDAYPRLRPHVRTEGQQNLF